MSKEKILVIDDESSIRSSLQGILEDEGFSVKTAESGEDGFRLLEKENFDLVLLDIWLPEMNGIEALKKIKTLEDNPQVVMISGHGNVETAVRATKLGAYDFLEKPLTLEKVILTVRNALKQYRLEEENIKLREKFKLKYHLVGKSRAILKVRAEVTKVAPTSGRVLITGENGTGKELLARLIHQQSQRRDKRFVEINCAAIPPELMESEIFGLQRGPAAAGKDKKGKLLLADGGTIFFDEIGDMNLTSQAKLVRVIEEHKVEPAGSSDRLPVDTRIIAATTKNLKELIGQGKFREDLFFKLNVIPFHLPPLRERRDDIPILIDHYLEHICAEYGRKKKTMDQNAIEAFLNYSWPGNVSELMNVIERFVIMVEETEINASHLSLLVEAREFEYIPGRSVRLPFARAKELFEKKYIHEALIQNGWDLAKTASDLKMETAALKDKVSELKIGLVN